jgi:hypothetical protein
MHPFGSIAFYLFICVADDVFYPCLFRSRNLGQSVEVFRNSWVVFSGKQGKQLIADAVAQKLWIIVGSILYGDDSFLVEENASMSVRLAYEQRTDDTIPPLQVRCRTARVARPHETGPTASVQHCHPSGGPLPILSYPSVRMIFLKKA